MPFDPSTEKFYQSPSTIVDSTPDGDTVQEGFDIRNTPAITQIYDDLNLLKTDGMIVIGGPATETSRGIARIATQEEVNAGKTGAIGPAFLEVEKFVASLTTTVDKKETNRAPSVKAVFDAFDKANARADSAYNLASSAGSGKAPIPTNAAGVGQIVAITAGYGSTVRLPSSGTWAYYATGTYGGAAQNLLYAAGVDAGGSTIRLNGDGNNISGFAWRIA